MKYNFESPMRSQNTQLIKWQLMFEKNQNSNFVPLSVADMEFELAPEIKDDLTHYIQNSSFGYTASSKDYTESVIRWFHDIHHINLNPNDMIQTAGVLTALRASVDILSQNGDDVLITSPVYGQFYKIIDDLNRNIIDVPLIYNQGIYTLNFQQLEIEMKKETSKVMILCNPHNPVGRVWTLEELTRIKNLAHKHHITIISDEIHSDILLNNNKFVSYACVDEKSIVCTAASKTFNLAALKTSNIFVQDSELQKELRSYLERYGLNTPNILGYVATQSAYTKGRLWYQQMLEIIQKNYNTVVDELKNTQLIISPLEGSYLLWFNYKAYDHDETTFNQRCMEHDLFFSLGSMFGKTGEGFMRMNLAVSTKTIKEATRKLLQVIQTYK